MRAAVPESMLEIARAHAPGGVHVGPVEAGVDGAAFVVPYWRGGDILDQLDGAPALKVVQVLSAGTDWIEERIPAHVTLCNSRGARDIPVAEWVVAAIAGDATGLLRFAARQSAREWRHERPREVAGRRVVVVGMGSIGEAVRRRLEALRADVVGVARSPRPGVHGVEELEGLLPDADAVVVLTPLTDATRCMVDADFLARMPDGALLVNAARGPVVDTGALLAELGRERLRAVLDVTDPEPLPPEHPLWSAPGVVVSPHVAGDSPEADERAQRFAAEQLARFARGEPLRNVVRSP
jgi:phosphoglycerate dehydrogenase-like enzyme